MKLFKVRGMLNSVKRDAQKSAYDKAVRIITRAHEIALAVSDTGQHASSLSLSIGTPKYNDGRSLDMNLHIDPFKYAKDGKFKVYITSGVDYAEKLEHGTYTNPGLPHWYHKPQGYVLKETANGYIVIRTTSEGFSNRAPDGIITQSIREIK